MKLKQVRQFAALAQTLNFHRAARQLNMSQPPLSVSIRKLEQEMGMPLFERLPRGVALTEAGRAALPHARSILNEIDMMQEAARAIVDGLGGRLSISFVGSAVYGLLPRVVPLFRARRPQVELRLREDTTLDILTGLRAGDLDLGVLRTPVFDAEDLHLEPLYREEMILVLPDGHPLGTGATVRLEDLHAESFIGYDRARLPSYHALTAIACDSAGFHPHIIEETAHVQTMIALVESGIGIALAPAVARIPGANRVRYARLTVQGEPILIGLALATRPGDDRPAPDAFKAALRTAVAQMLADDPLMAAADS